LRMSEIITYKETGFDELDRAVQLLPERVAARVLKNAVRAAARVIVKVAKQNAPKKTGDLKKAIAVKAGKVKDDTVFAYVVIKKEKAWYGFLVEWGTKVFSARHFILNAFSSTKTSQLAALKKSLTDGIIREADRL